MAGVQPGVDRLALAQLLDQCQLGAVGRQPLGQRLEQQLAAVLHPRHRPAGRHRPAHRGPQARQRGQELAAGGVEQPAGGIQQIGRGAALLRKRRGRAHQRAGQEQEGEEQADADQQIGHRLGQFDIEPPGQQPVRRPEVARRAEHQHPQPARHRHRDDALLGLLPGLAQLGVSRNHLAHGGRAVERPRLAGRPERGQRLGQRRAQPAQRRQEPEQEQADRRQQDAGEHQPDQHLATKEGKGIQVTTPDSTAGHGSCRTGRFLNPPPAGNRRKSRAYFGGVTFFLKFRRDRFQIQPGSAGFRPSGTPCARPASAGCGRRQPLDGARAAPARPRGRARAARRPAPDRRSAAARRPTGAHP